VLISGKFFSSVLIRGYPASIRGKSFVVVSFSDHPIHRSPDHPILISVISVNQR